jgi:hypothetical protein
MKRPGALAEVAAWTETRQEFHYHLADFLDQFYLAPDAAMLTEEPTRLAGKVEQGDVFDAYLAAVAVSLARLIRAFPPAWACHESRKLRSPWFAHPGRALRATLLLESPTPFRERNLFVSENALGRA